MNKEDHYNSPLDKDSLKKVPFQVGDGYFNGLSDRIMNAVDAEESDLKYNLHLKKSPFTAPNGYFAELSASIEKGIIEETKQRKFYQQPLTRWLAVAASLALLVTVYFNQPTEVNSDLLSSVSDETIISFLESENGLADELLISVEEIDSVLDAIYDDETGIFVNTIESNPELEYDFEYFDY